MGTLRLLVPESIATNRRYTATIHMIRFDTMPWPCRVEVDGTRVSLHRLVNQSAQVCLAYPLAEFGELTLRTGTLPERTEPYVLPIELARGTLDRLRNQLESWRDLGLQISREIDAAADQSVDKLSDAILAEGDFERQTELAEESLTYALQGIFALCHEYARQYAALRSADVEMPTSLGVRVAAERLPAEWLSLLPREFQFVCVEEHSVLGTERAVPRVSSAPLRSQVQIDGRKTIAGPIWDAGKSGLPDQINEIIHFETKRVAARDHFVRMLNQIERPPDWLYAASGLNGIGHRFLSYPQQLQMLVDLLQTIEEIRWQTPVLISFDFPWSERLAWSVGGTQSLQIADLLLRHDVRFSGLGLEINLDYWPLGSLPRDPLQWLELVDCWAQFGLPLFLFLRIPSGAPHSSEPEQDGPLRHSFSGAQKWKYIDGVLSIVLSRPFVQSVVWSDWSDDQHGPFPWGGLFDSQGRTKPILSLLTGVYQRLSAPNSQPTG